MQYRCPLWLMGAVNVHAEMHIFNLWHCHIHFSLDTTPSLRIKKKQIFE